MAVERLALLLETLGANAAISDVRKLGGAVQGIASSAGVGTSGLRNLSIAGVSAGDVLKNSVVAGALGAGAAITGFAAVSVKSFVDATSSVRQFQAASGASAEDASRLVFAMEHVGISAETASRGIFLLGKNLELNGPKLASYGVVAARGADGNVDLAATLLRVVDAYKATTDPGERAALVTAAFGKSAQAFLPFLARGREGIAALFAEAESTGQVFDPEDLRKGKEFSEQMKLLTADLKQIGIVVGRVVVPVFSDLIGILDRAAAGGKTLVGALSHIPGVSTVFEGIANWGHAAGTAVNWLAGADEKQTSTADDNAAANALAAAADQERQLAADELSQSIFGVVDANRAVEAASRSVDAARRSQTAALDELHKLQTTHGVDTAKVAAAQRSLAEATLSAGHAQREQGKAQTEYAAALANANDLHGYDTAQATLADAADKLADANDNVTSAQERQAAAAAELAKAKEGDPEYQSKVAAAKQKVADTTQNVADAEFDFAEQSSKAIDIHKAETIAIAGKADEMERLLKTLQGLLALRPELAPFFGPAIQTLQSGLAAVPPTTLKPQGFIGPLAPGEGILAGPALPPPTKPPGFIGPLQPGQQVAAGPVTNNFTINTTSDADARAIAREVIWNLN